MNLTGLANGGDMIVLAVIIAVVVALLVLAQFIRISSANLARHQSEWIAQLPASQKSTSNAGHIEHRHTAIH